MRIDGFDTILLKLILYSIERQPQKKPVFMIFEETRTKKQDSRFQVPKSVNSHLCIELNLFY
jgi:hypothetical protein